MAFWWPLLVLGFAFALCRFLLMLIPPNVPSIDVDASDGTDLYVAPLLDDGKTKENSFIYESGQFRSNRGFWTWEVVGGFALLLGVWLNRMSPKHLVAYLLFGIGIPMQIPSRGRTPEKVQCYEPATMKYLGFCPALRPDEVREHVAQARKAQKIWARSSFKQRRQFLRILLKYIIEHQELICDQMTCVVLELFVQMPFKRISSRDTGKTMVDASLGEIMTTCEKITWLLSEGERWLKPEYRSTGRSMLHKTAKVEFHPLGVIGAIVSWNYPFHNIFNPMLAAVFSGNGVVIKAALAAVGAPENLVDVITGFAETGEALVSSVDKIIFVGSPGVGKTIMRNASDTLIPVTLELGGKDAFIVCEDVDVPHVAQIAVRAALQSSGQNCAGAERFYVHQDIYSKFVAEVVRIVKSVTAGPPLSGKYDMGAICMQEHSEKLQNLVNEALDKGAEFAGRGSFGNLGEDAVDQFFPPTVLVNVNHSMQLMQEEAFGPILPIMKFSSDEEVVKLANDSRYGLGCAVFSGSQRRAKAIASQIHCGMAAINDFASTYMCQSLPFGGVKDSGFGRFAGIEGLRACCLVKSVVEDRWWPFIKTKIPKPIQYPVADNGFEFQESLVEALYGLNVWDRLRALVHVLKMLTEQNTPSNSTKRKND
ncbi:Aldehyde dehydrogenase 22A1 [Vitis vinifera]|uniref:Aldehyde dehydrogenase 22A1 n=1 Tax=Vitis vinifera TaxID=29760 RepID=A0A438DWV0_VITVI|nr:Aldehyde dehydrogenase 22A1 [Vitis vinifera]